jgi:hypothetical protein
LREPEKEPWRLDELSRALRNYDDLIAYDTDVVLGEGAARHLEHLSHRGPMSGVVRRRGRMLEESGVIDHDAIVE